MPEQKKTRELHARPLRVLPCVTAPALSGYFTPLATEIEIDLLPIARPSALSFRVRSDRPDAIIIATDDFSLTARRHSSSLREAFSATPTLLLASQVDASQRRRARHFHIRSTLPLNVTTDQLLAAIFATVAGLAVTLELSLPEEEEDAFWNAADERFEDNPTAEHLTARETVVLSLMALGHGNKEIASRLNISEHTVKFHVSSILAKLDAATRTEAVTIGILRGHVAI